MRRSLTKRQIQVLDAIRYYWETHGLAPSSGEVGKALNISRQTAHLHMKVLEKKGQLNHREGYGRSWRPRDLRPPPPNDSLATKSIPLLYQVIAGRPILTTENIEAWITLDQVRSCDSFFALRVHGHSMVKAGIFDGGIVVIRQQATFNNGDIVLAIVGDKATIKRFKCNDNQVCLIPENDAMEPMYYDPEEVIFQGKLIEVRRSLE